jgi:ADP-ribose pyrophosphatase YjhB (NUDIX family)
MSLHNKFHKLFQNCPACKSKLGRDDNRVFCEACEFELYDNPAIATSIALIKDKKILLAKRRVEPQKGMWDILGGFVDAGESIEECAVREMKEEAGLNVEIEEYLGSMADVYGGRPTTPVMFRVKSIDGHKKPIAQDDVEELRWFSLNEIPKNIAFENVKIIISKVKKYLI